LIVMIDVQDSRGSGGLIAVVRLDGQRKDHLALRLRYSAAHTYLLSRWANRYATTENAYRYVAYDMIVSVLSHVIFSGAATPLSQHVV
jgi:type 1 glutamine amidotransferase